MKSNFKPKFLNHIDVQVLFNGLSREDLHEIIKLEANGVEKRIDDCGRRLILSDDALDCLVENGCNLMHGACPLKQTIQQELETIVAKAMPRGEFGNGDTLIVDTSGGGGGKLTVTRGFPPIEAAEKQRAKTV